MRTLSDVPEVTVKVAKLGFEPRNLGGTLRVLNQCPEFCHGQQCVEPRAPVQGLPRPPHTQHWTASWTVSHGYVLRYQAPGAQLHAWHRVGAG